MAGDTATHLLMPGEHNPFRSKEDRDAVNTFLGKFGETQRRDVSLQARSLAEKWMREGSKAILVLTQALEARALDGPDAEGIVKENSERNTPSG